MTQFNIGDRVRRTGGKLGTIKEIQTIYMIRWDGAIVDQAMNDLPNMDMVSRLVGIPSIGTRDDILKPPTITYEQAMWAQADAGLSECRECDHFVHDRCPECGLCLDYECCTGHEEGA